VERFTRRPREHKDEEAEGALRDRRDHGDGDRAAKAGGGTGVANTEEEPPQPDRRVVKDECCSGAPVERENGDVHLRQKLAHNARMLEA